MIDFHGTLMVSDCQIKRKSLFYFHPIWETNTTSGVKIRKESLLSFYPIRKVVGLLSGFRWFVKLSNSKLYPNYDLIERLNRIGEDSSMKIYVVSAAHESSRDIMEGEIKKIGLKNFACLILRDNIFESHTKYKVEMAKELHADEVVEDCLHYGLAIKKALPNAVVRCPNWYRKLA
jgi:hypothetical protein